MQSAVETTAHAVVATTCALEGVLAIYYLTHSSYSLRYVRKYYNAKIEQYCIYSVTPKQYKICLIV